MYMYEICLSAHPRVRRRKSRSDSGRILAKGFVKRVHHDEKLNLQLNINGWELNKTIHKRSSTQSQFTR